MVFSSTLFLFLFLPVVLAASLVAPRPLRNPLLLAASLVFYAWGEGAYVLLMLASVLANWALGLLLERSRRPRTVVLASVLFNLGLLVTFKYANFLGDNLDPLLEALGLPPLALDPVHLPIGVSFFTFQAMSYVTDVSRGQARAQRNPVDIALYIALFPQLIAGPIVRYRDVAEQIRQRVVGLPRFASGVSRFVIGLGKKVLIANTLAVPADRIFALPETALGPGLCWLGVACYALQIYFDFSGYSDMAIGLGRMFGFEFLENFEHPYVARSITGFWRRWHISLSSWFRDYLYIPLGGNRGGALATGRNLVLVFLLCGLWHGAAWTFVIWGLFHGAFLVLERGGLLRVLAALPRPVQHVYTLAVVLVGWVFFRAGSLPQAGTFLAALVGGAHVPEMPLLDTPLLDAGVLLAGAAGVIGSVPWLPALGRAVDRWRERSTRPPWLESGVELGRVLALLAILVLSAARLSSATYNPFIYFRF